MPHAQAPSPDDILSIQLLTDAQLSPDGDTVAFVVAETIKDKTRKPKSRIWIVPAAGGEAQPFTTGPRSDAVPRWSPDGQWLAFLSDRLEDGQYQLYVMPHAGGEARALTETKGSLSDPRWLAWSPDGRQIAFLMSDPESDEERRRRDERDDPLEYEQHHKFTRVWLVDVATRALRCVTTADFQVWEAEWSPDGQHFALLVSAEPYEWAWYEAELARVPAAGGAPVTLARPAPRQISTPRWSPDGRSIAYLTCAWSDRGAVGGDLYVMSAAGGAATNLTVDYRGSVRWMEWSPDGQTLLALSTEGAHAALVSVPLDGRLRRLWVAPVGLSERFQPSFSSAHGGARLAVVREDCDHPRDVWIGARQAGGAYDWQQLTHWNTHTSTWALGTVEELQWTSADGLAIHGLLVRPPADAPERRYPMVTIVHGGPSAVYDCRFSPTIMWGWAHLLAARGYAVLLPNPRGSFGWGTAFTESNLGDMGGKDLQDILSGVDYCVAQGFADAERLAVAGWSYGGFMTAWAVTQTPRFKAAVMGAGISNWQSFHGTSTLSTWDRQYYLVSPYERDGTYERFSAISYVKQVRTPTLIVHGQNDPVVPVGQAYEFFRALKELGVPVELVVYPREEHAILEKLHRLHLLNTMTEWITRHVPAD